MNLTPGNKYLFDTCVFIDLLRGRQTGKNFHYQVRFMRIAVAYSIVTEIELWSGIKGLWTEAQHTEILKAYSRKFINVTIARDGGSFYSHFSNIEKLDGKNLPGINDCLITATARFYGFRLLSKNTRHMPKFRQFGVIVDEYSDTEKAL